MRGTGSRGLAAPAARKRLGSWYTPPALIERILDGVVTADWVQRRGSALRVIDPACGDGRFLAAVDARARALGGRCTLVGTDVDGDAVRAARAQVPHARIEHADALIDRPSGEPFDLVVGNPPFLSQMAAATTRGGASPLGGGPYADTATEFLALATDLADPDGGRIGFVLPESLLSARDAAPVRDDLDGRASMIWSWSSEEHLFDAQVRTCALGFEMAREASGRHASRASGREWTAVVNRRRGVPDPPAADSIVTDGVLADRAWLNANFRDEYYGLVPAVADHLAGPPLVTSGLIDPGVCHWGRRSVRFAKQRFSAPRVDLRRLDDRMRRWASRRLLPKVLVANQTPIIEAVCDPTGEWLPGVPVVSAYPDDPALAWEIAAVLSSPFASAWAWRHQGGSGLSANTIRVGPVLLGELPWPGGELAAAVDALRAGDVGTCGALIDAAYGIGRRDDMAQWWRSALDRIAERDRPDGAVAATV